MFRYGRSVRRFVIAVTAWALVVPATPASAAQGPAPALPLPVSDAYVAGRVLVGFDPGTASATIGDLRLSFGVLGETFLGAYRGRAEAWELPAGMSVESVIAALTKYGIVRYAEPDWRVESLATSDDPYYTGGSLWGMYGDATAPANQFGSQAGEAWAAGQTGSSAVYVGIIDEGIDFSHPDLDGNIWTNPYEIPGNGIDDDGNGYRDDVHGWDFYSNNASVYDAGQDQHGTHVAGTIGAEGGNGLGVAGVNWDVTFISGKFLGPTGGSTTGAIAAVNYFTDLKTRHGLNIVATSNSWGGGGYSQALADAIDRGGDAGILFIAAAGNSSSNNDVSYNYPSNYQCTRGGTRGWDCVVAVAAIDSGGGLAWFSSYGRTTVDLGAPGVDIVSTQPGAAYASFSGTSMATPHVSGAVALCKSVNPALDARGLRSALLGSVTATPSLSGITSTGGRLDVGALVAACTPSTSAVSGTPTSLLAVAAGPLTVDLTWTDTSSNETAFEVQRASGTAGSCSGWTTIGTLVGGTTAWRVGGLTASTNYCFRVRATNTFNGGTTTSWSNEASARTLAPPDPYACAVTAYAWIDPTQGTALAMSSTDDGAATVSSPFPLRFFGKTYSTATVSTNGYVVLGSGSGAVYSNLTIPSTSEPNAIVAALWDDLLLGGGAVYARTVGSAPNRSFVIGWQDVRGWTSTGGTAGTGTFEVVFDEASGAILLQYLDVDFASSAFNGGIGATVGVEDETGAFGTRIGFNQNVLAAGRAYRCSDAVAPVSISTAALASGTAGVAYSATLASTPGKAPYVWTLADGTLPSGLTLSSSGVISGTPTLAGTSTVTLRVTDSAATPTSASRIFTITIGAGKRSPSTGTSLARGTTTTTLQWFGHAEATAYRYCYAQTAAGCTNWVSTGSGLSASITGLALGRTYYWQVQAQVGGVWVGANGGTLWTFRTRR